MTETYTPDKLLAGDYPAVTDIVTILSGQNLVRGALLGKVTIGAATPAAVAGNTGNGTLAAATVSGAAKPGVYRAVCIEPGTNLGKFTIEDPDGITVGVATVGTEFVGGGLTFTIADGSTDFASGDAFTITVAAGSGKYKQCDSTNTDGSQAPLAILAEACDASGGDAQATVYLSGAFTESGVTFGGTDTAATHRAALRDLNIYLKKSVAA
jgi:hypothetical protein